MSTTPANEDKKRTPAGRIRGAEKARNARREQIRLRAERAGFTVYDTAHENRHESIATNRQPEPMDVSEDNGLAVPTGRPEGAEFHHFRFPSADNNAVLPVVGIMETQEPSQAPVLHRPVYSSTPHVQYDVDNFRRDFLLSAQHLDVPKEPERPMSVYENGVYLAKILGGATLVGGVSYGSYKAMEYLLAKFLTCKCCAAGVDPTALEKAPPQGYPTPVPHGFFGRVE